MSQVVATNDNFRERREKSRLQERQIVTDGGLEQWRNPNGGFVALLEKAVGLAALPLVLFWSLILACLGVGLGLGLILFRTLASFIPAFHKAR